MNFSDIIKKIMDDRDLKQADLCKMTNIPSSLMSAYVQGKKSPALNNAMLIAMALNVSLDVLVGHDDKRINYNSMNANEQQLIKKYRALDERGKDVVDTIVERQYEIIKPKGQDEVI